MQQRFSADQVADAVAYFEANGYAVFRDVISPCMAEAFWSDVEDNVRDNPDLRFSLYGRVMRQAELPDELRIALPRIIDIQGYVPLTGHLMLCRPIADFLVTAFGGPIACLQTLTYKFSSEQGAHSDKYLVSPPYVGEYARDTLAAAWFAFEASNKVNGALVIYPGSHKVRKKRLETDFNGDYGAYVNYLDGLCRDAGCPPENYEARPGEVLIWHGDLVHAGGPVLQQSPRPTRKSLVCHYAVVPEDRSSLLPDWVRMRCTRGSYYVPAAGVM
jgi:ectoine hydroxylase-related dioxygenase (phytanoyl-CoA dioxygenase family)